MFRETEILSGVHGLLPSLSDYTVFQKSILNLCYRSLVLGAPQ